MTASWAATDQWWVVKCSLEMLIQPKHLDTILYIWLSLSRGHQISGNNGLLLLLFGGLWKTKADYMVQKDKDNIFYFSRGWRTPPSPPWFNSYNSKNFEQFLRVLAQGIVFRTQILQSLILVFQTVLSSSVDGTYFLIFLSLDYRFETKNCILHAFFLQTLLNLFNKTLRFDIILVKGLINISSFPCRTNG